MSIEAVDLLLIGHFANLEDPRDASKARHKLLDMVAIAIAGVMCGADDWVSIEVPSVFRLPRECPHAT